MACSFYFNRAVGSGRGNLVICDFKESEAPAAGHPVEINAHFLELCALYGLHYLVSQAPACIVRCLIIHDHALPLVEPFRWVPSSIPCSVLPAALFPPKPPTPVSIKPPLVR